MRPRLLAVDYSHPLSDDLLVQAVRVRGCRPETPAERDALRLVENARSSVVSAARGLAEARRRRCRIGFWSKEVAAAVAALDIAELDERRVAEHADADAWRRVGEIEGRAARELAS